MIFRDGFLIRFVSVVVELLTKRANTTLACRDVDVTRIDSVRGLATANHDSGVAMVEPVSPNYIGVKVETCNYFEPLENRFYCDTITVG